MAVDDGLFVRNTKKTVKEVLAVITERAKQYGDSWSEVEYLTFKAIIKKITNNQVIPSNDECRAMAAAIMCDIKYHRLKGGYKKDTIIDLISYESFLASQMETLKEEGTSNGNEKANTE